MPATMAVAQLRAERCSSAMHHAATSAAVSLPSVRCTATRGAMREQQLTPSLRRALLGWLDLLPPHKPSQPRLSRPCSPLVNLDSPRAPRLVRLTSPSLSLPPSSPPICHGTPPVRSSPAPPVSNNASAGGCRAVAAVCDSDSVGSDLSAGAQLFCQPRHCAHGLVQPHLRRRPLGCQSDVELVGERCRRQRLLGCSPRPRAAGRRHCCQRRTVHRPQCTAGLGQLLRYNTSAHHRRRRQRQRVGRHGRLELRVDIPQRYTSRQRQGQPAARHAPPRATYSLLLLLLSPPPLSSSPLLRPRSQPIRHSPSLSRLLRAVLCCAVLCCAVRSSPSAQVRRAGTSLLVRMEAALGSTSACTAATARTPMALRAYSTLSTR